MAAIAGQAPTPTYTAQGYRATRTAKALIIHDVEIFSACTRDDFVADEHWVKQAVEKAMAEAREGYHPPLHIRHHANDGEPVVAAGHFEITGVRPITLGGKRRNAVFADLHIKDAWTQKQVLDEMLSYRSVEIFDTTEPPSIDGLALLDHEAPYLRLPMLMVSTVDDQTNGRASFARFRRGHSFNPLDRHEETMSKKTDIATFGAGIIEPDPIHGAQFAEDPPPKKEGDDDKGAGMEGAGTLDVSAVVKAIRSGAISIADMDEILGAIQEQGAEKQVEEEAPAPAAAPGAEAMKAQPGAMSAEMAAREGKIVALEARLDERDANDTRRDDVAAALQRLDGLPAGANLEERLVAFHKEAKGNKVLFKAFVDSIAQNTAPAQPAKGEFQGFGAKVPDVAMSYMNKGGTGAVDRAANFARQWHSLAAAGGMQCSLERYVEINMTQDQEIEA